MPDSDLVMAFMETLEGLKRYRRWPRGGEDLPIRNNAMMLLMFLHHNLPHDAPGIQPSELGEILGLTRPTITSLVNTLEEHGFVERINDDEDRRVVFVKPTTQGEDLVHQSKAVFLQNISEILDYLGTEDGKEIVRIMGRIREFFEEKKNVQEGGKGTCGN